MGLLLAVSFSFGLLALEGAIRVYSGLGHFSATRCFFGALTVIFLDIACIGLVVSVTVSLVTMVVVEGAISAGRSSVIRASKGLLGGDLVSGRRDGVLVSGGSVVSESKISVMDTVSGSRGGPDAGHNWLALATAASTSGELPSGREGSSSCQSSAAADELLVSGGAKSMRSLGRDFFLRRFGLIVVNLALGRPKAAPEQNA